MLQKIISSGESGVDRAALDIGLALGLPVGGWCAPDRQAEDGRIAERYPVLEMLEPGYHLRIQRHIEACDGVLILALGQSRAKGMLSATYAQEAGKPSLLVKLEQGIDPLTFGRWLTSQQIAILYVTGLRERQQPGIHTAASRCLTLLLGSQLSTGFVDNFADSVGVQPASLFKNRSRMP
jgi:hypothetical protein